MAERRMFAKTIIDSDAFLDMPATSQILYFHLAMRADDDGFVNNPKKIQRMIGANDDDMKLIIAKHFILVFESGVVVIKHWRMNNYIQKDRYKPTVYQREMNLLQIKQNGAYRLIETECIQNGYSLDSQVRLGKVRLGKDIDHNNDTRPREVVKVRQQIPVNEDGHVGDVFVQGAGGKNVFQQYRESIKDQLKPKAKEAGEG